MEKGVEEKTLFSMVFLATLWGQGKCVEFLQQVRIGSQDMWRLKEICSENLKLMNAGIILRNNGKLPIF